MDLFVNIFTIIGTIAFAISGSMVALKKGMDIFGTIVLGLTTAVGGGIVRDLLLGITPPSALIKPMNAIIAIFTSLIIFIIFYFLKSTKDNNIYRILLLISDSAGLGIFTVWGVKVAIDAGFMANSFLVVFVATITGVGGGILRDIFAGDKPYVFVKHIYACASIAGAIVSLLLWPYLHQSASMIIGFFIIIIIRFLSSKFRLELPKIKTLNM